MTPSELRRGAFLSGANERVIEGREERGFVRLVSVVTRHADDTPDAEELVKEVPERLLRSVYREDYKYVLPGHFGGPGIGSRKSAFLRVRPRGVLVMQGWAGWELSV